MNVLTAAFYAASVPGFHLGHFDKVTSLAGCRDYGGNLYRGGEITGEAGWAKLKALGIDYVIDLRNEADLGDERAAISRGFNYVNIPLRTSGTHSDDTVERTRDSLRLIERMSLTGRKFYIHCQRGEDRTGVVIGMLRRCDAWAREFRSYGGVMYSPLRDLWERIAQ